MENINLYYNDIPDTIVWGNEISIDTETMGLDLTRDRLCLIQIKNQDNTIHLVQFKDSNYQCKNLKKLLSNPKILKIFHYARFDMLAIYSYLNIMCENIFCTKIASKLCRTYTDKHSLKVLCKELLNIDLQKEQQSSNWGVEKLSSEQLQYASFDVIYLPQIKNQLTQMLIQENRLILANQCFNFLQTQVLLDKLNFIDIFNH